LFLGEIVLDLTKDISCYSVVPALCGCRNWRGMYVGEESLDVLSEGLYEAFKGRYKFQYQTHL
jgi:hypothetical protein